MRIKIQSVRKPETTLWTTGRHQHQNRRKPVTQQRISRLDDILAEGECETLELKTGVPEPGVLARHIAALANTAGGTIVLGIDERLRSISPVSEVRARKSYKRALQLLMPQPETQLYVVDSIRGSVVCIDVGRGEQGPVSLDGVILKRVGSTDRPVTESELHALLHAQLHKTDPDSKLEATEQNLAAILARQSARLDEIRQAQIDGRHWKNRLPDILISGVVGALLGVILTALFL